MGKDVGYGVMGKLWRVIRRMYKISRKCCVKREVGFLQCGAGSSYNI